MTVVAPRTLLLDDVAGWRVARQENVARDPHDGAWTLPPLPGISAEDEQWPPSLARHFLCPEGLSDDTCGRLLLVDSGLHSASQIDVDDWSARPFPFGGLGSAPRRFRHPRGIARISDGVVAIADTGNHRIQVFTAPAWTLTELLGATGRNREPVSGSGMLEFCDPWRVKADGCGGFYVVDRGNHRVHHIGWNLGSVRVFGRSVLRDPIDLALLDEGVLAVADPVRGGVDLFDSDGRWIDIGGRSPDDGPSLVAPGGALSVAAGSDGRLYAGDDRGRIHVWDRSTTGEWDYIDAAVTGLDGPVTGLAVLPDGGLVALIVRRSNTGRRPDIVTLWRLRPDGMHRGPGRVWTAPLDSEIEACRWDRIELDGTIPQGTHVDIATYSAEDPNPPDDRLFEEHRVRLGPGDRNTLIRSAPARYLWIRLGLGTDGIDTPKVRGLKIHFPRHGYLRFLPAVFQEDEESRNFLERFLAVFQTELDDLNGVIDRIWQLFDPAAVDEKHLRWLAGWLAVRLDPEWESDQLRSMIREAWSDHIARGTAPGLVKAIRDYARTDARIVEHYRLRRWTALSWRSRLDGTTNLWSRDFYRRLQLDRYSQLGSVRLLDRPTPTLEPVDWGAHTFSVMFAANPLTVDHDRERVSSVVEREKPAHTTAVLCPVYPRMRVGVQAAVGVDARVGAVSPLVLCRLSTLGYDSVLGCRPEESSLRQTGTTAQPRISISARLR